KVALPCVRHMARPASRRDHDDVEAPVELCEIGPAREEMVEGARDPSALLREDAVGGDVERGTRFDLDRDHDAATARDQVDFARGHAKPPRENAIAFEPQQPDAQQFGMTAASFGTLAACRRHAAPSLSASARA